MVDIRLLLLLALLAFATQNTSTLETGLNETRQDTSPANTETTTGSFFTSTSEPQDTTTTRVEEVSTTSVPVTTSESRMSSNDGQPVLIGNSQQPTVLQVDTSTQTSTAPSDQTKMFESSSAPSTTWTTTTTSTASPTEPSTSETTAKLNTSWVPGKFPPPGLETGSEAQKEMTTASAGVEWKVNTTSSEDPNKHKYDVMIGDQPAESGDEKMSTSKNMDSPTSDAKMPADSPTKSVFTRSPPTVTSTKNVTVYPVKGTGVGSSKEVNTEGKPVPSNSRKENGGGNGAGQLKDSLHLMVATSFLVFAYLRV